MSISINTWQSALDSQSACNPSGLAHFLVDAIQEIRASGVHDTDAICAHPIVRLVVAQLLHLTYRGQTTKFELWSDAYDRCRIEIGQHPDADRALEPGEREELLKQLDQKEAARWQATHTATSEPMKSP